MYTVERWLPPQSYWMQHQLSMSRVTICEFTVCPHLLVILQSSKPKTTRPPDRCYGYKYSVCILCVYFFSLLLPSSQVAIIIPQSVINQSLIRRHTFSCFHYPITSPFPWFKKPSQLFPLEIHLSGNLSVVVWFCFRYYMSLCPHLRVLFLLCCLMVGKGGTKTSCPWAYTTRR